MIKRKCTNFIKFPKNNLCVKMQNTNLEINLNYPTVSLIQRPGDSYIRNITLIPGEGIGRELVSNYKFIK